MVERSDLVLEGVDAEDLTRKRALGFVVKSTISELKRNRTLTIGVIVLSLITLYALLAPPLLKLDPISQNLPKRLTPPIWLQGGDSQYVLGTDQLGRDILARLTYGIRMSLAIGVGSVILGGTLGVTLGMISGYIGRFVDIVIMRVAELQMAFPFMILAIIVMALFEPSPLKIVLVFTMTSWPVYARIVRGVALSLREEAFILAERALGASQPYMIIRHILPNILPYGIVLASLELSIMIITEGALSFIGVGIQPPTPYLGVMLSEGRKYLTTAWWLATFPGIVLMILILGANFLGDGVRDTVDPTLKERV